MPLLTRLSALFTYSMSVERPLRNSGFQFKLGNSFVPFARRKNFVGRGSLMLHPKKLRRILTVAIVAYLPERLAIYWSEPKPRRSGNFFRVIWRGLQREKARRVKR